MKPELEAEAAAFDRRIDERIAAGFVPDLRRAGKCTFFYKSFWRDPHFIKLYLVEEINNLLEMLRKHSGRSLRILDVGCGAGYMTLEFARAGHRVLGIDISRRCIEIAREFRDSNPYTDGFGSLDYEATTLDEVKETFDCVLFSGSLHHFSDPSAAVGRATELLSAEGLVLAYEPCHDQWRLQDAAQVALIRELLALTGFWYEKPATPDDPEPRLSTLVHDIHAEYVNERDKDEAGGQSPNDNSASGEDVLAALRGHLSELEHRPGASFIYRLLGGLRGQDETVYKIADFLAAYEKYAVGNGFLKPNGFYFLGRALGDRRRGTDPPASAVARQEV